MEQYFGATHISHRDGNGTGSRPGRPIPILSRLFFSIPKLIPFKKLNGAGQGMRMEKFAYPVPFTFDFYFLLYNFFYYIKINIFHKK